MFADLVPGTGACRFRSAASAALDAASLLAALDRYPYRCSEQITSRALPLLYVSDLASEAHVALDRRREQRIRDAIEALLTRQDSTGSFGLWGVGGDDVWLDAYVTDFLTRAREHKFAVPDTAFKLALDRLRNVVADSVRSGQERRRPISPMRSMCWRATAWRRSATFVISPTPSSTRWRRRSPRRSLPRRWRWSAIAPAPSGSMRRRWRRSRPQPPPISLGREDYGSTLRDAAAVVTLAAEGGAAAATVQAAVQRVEAARAPLRPTSTQEDAWLLLAASAMAKDAGKMSLDVGGKTVQRRSTGPSAPPI